MPSPVLWIHRQFTFDTPLTMFPNIVERLRGTPARITERTQNLDQTTLTAKTEQTWSIQETIGHLTIIDRIWISRLDDFRSKSLKLREADIINQATTDASYNDQLPADIISEFHQIRLDFVDQLEQLDETTLNHIARHPRLDAPMRVIDLMFFAAEHDDHHLAQITTMIADP